MRQHRAVTVAEEPLAGGMDNAGAVVRVGDTVRRPVKNSAAAVHALLIHLEGVGFEGAPRYLGIDEQGREVLSYIAGQAPLPPYPAWSMTDEALIEVARLLRRFHDAASSFDATGFGSWATEWADPVGGSLVCHNDVYPENVLFRDGRAVALIDFDLAAPGRFLWDVAVAAQQWAPLNAPETRHYHPRHLDGVARFGRFARAYGVEVSTASSLVDMVFTSRQTALAHIRGEIDAGNTTWVDNWRETNGEERSAADDAWLESHRKALVEAIAD
jgi:hypothetical protein